MKDLDMNLKALVGASALCCVSLASAQNLVTDGDFSAPNLAPDWGIYAPDGGIYRSPSVGLAGPYSCFFGPDPYGKFKPDGYIYQSLNTTVGTNYTLSFHIDDESVATSGAFEVSVTGAASDVIELGSIPQGDTLESYSFKAASSKTLIEFVGQFPGGQQWELGSVSVTPNAVPSPTSGLSLAAGLGVFGLLRKKRGR